MERHDADAAVALGYLDALGGTDPATVVGFVSAQFVNEHHAELGSGCVGRDEYARRLPGFFDAFANRWYDVIEYTVGPSLTATCCIDADRANQSVVVVNYRFHADVDGTHIDIPGLMWITVEDGEVIGRVDCWDSATFYRQTGSTSSNR